MYARDHPRAISEEYPRDREGGLFRSHAVRIAVRDGFDKLCIHATSRDIILCVVAPLTGGDKLPLKDIAR